MNLVLGLGNPGHRYRGTRHNLGFEVLERLAARWRAAEQEATPEYHWWRARPAESEVALVAPRTFMNRSGAALRAWRERQGREEALLVIADDVWLPLGVLRLRARGSSGGHRGLESLEAEAPGGEFQRLRIGVGAAASTAELREHVLEAFAPEERAAAEEAVERAADAVESWMGQGLQAAMNRFNRKFEQEAEET